MSHQPIYISRQQAETFLAEFAKALNQPSSQPLLFQVHGIGGVGKSTLLRKLQEIYQQQADFAEVSFGLTEGIETPLKLMATLYELLPKPSTPSIWKRDLLNWEPPPDPFISLDEQYQQTLLALQNQSVSGKLSVDGEQQSAVKDLLELGILTLFSATGVASLDTAIAALGKGVGMLKDAPQTIATGKDRVLQLLQQHPATKGKKELQELMLEPLPKLTQAFAQGLIQKAEKRPIVLVLDTYEKAPSAIDLWLCQYLLGNTELKSDNVRIVVAGRYNLLKTEYWRKLQQDRELVYAQSLERFDQEQTADYLQQIGITEQDDVGEIYKATKGLPYYLNWIRREKLAGQEIDFSQGNQAIVELLLQGLNPTQKQVLQLAACCRWFDKGLIRHLMNAQNMDFERAADDRLNCFEWLTQRDFTEFAQHRYRLDDVARDVFRLSLWQEDKEQFYQIHGLLADYFKERADREVPPDSPPPAQYNNPDWCSYIAEFLYHALFSRQRDTQRQFISHLFASRYFEQDEVVKVPLTAITAEADLTDHPLLNYATQQFLTTIKPAVEWGDVVLEVDLKDFEEDEKKLELIQKIRSASPVSAAIQLCFSQIDLLEGLAKFTALLYKSRCCPESHRLGWLQQAEVQAELIATPTAPEFSSALFWRDLGNELVKLGRLKEALIRFDKAVQIKSDSHEAWYNEGWVLSKLGCFDEALIRFGKAVEIKPEYHKAWCNQGKVLSDLGRDQEALVSYKKALEFQSDDDMAWYNQGNVLLNLERLDESFTSFDKATQINPNNYEAWNNRGTVLVRLGRIDEALSSYNKALQIMPDHSLAWYNRGLVLSYLGCLDEAIASYDKAAELKPDYYEAWNQRGNALFSLGRLEEAITSFDKTLQLKADYYETWYERGAALGSLGRLEEAIASCDKALEFKIDYYEAWWIRGIVLEAMGRLEEAITSYDQVLAVKPDLHQAWSNRGNALDDLGRFEEALASYDKALEIQPNDASTFYNKACCYALRGNLELAIENLQQAINLNPDEYREMAKTDSDFDSIRDDEQFQALLQEPIN